MPGGGFKPFQSHVAVCGFLPLDSMGVSLDGLRLRIAFVFVVCDLCDVGLLVRCVVSGRMVESGGFEGGVVVFG